MKKASGSLLSIALGVILFVSTCLAGVEPEILSSLDEGEILTPARVDLPPLGYLISWVIALILAFPALKRMVKEKNLRADLEALYVGLFFLVFPFILAFFINEWYSLLIMLAGIGVFGAILLRKGKQQVKENKIVGKVQIGVGIVLLIPPIMILIALLIYLVVHLLLIGSFLIKSLFI